MEDQREYPENSQRRIPFPGWFSYTTGRSGSGRNSSLRNSSHINAGRPVLCHPGAAQWRTYPVRSTGHRYPGTTSQHRSAAQRSTYGDHAPNGDRTPGGDHAPSYDRAPGGNHTRADDPVPTTPPTNQPPSGPSPNPSPGPTEPAELFLSVLAPRDGSTVPGSAVVAYGLTLREASVTVNGVPATVDINGGFRAETDLNPGINVVEIVATTEAGDNVVVRRTVDSLSLPPQPFLLVIDEPPPQSIVAQPRQRLAGHTSPQAVVSVNGVSVAVNPFGAFDTTVTLEPGPNIIEVVSTNQDGQVLSAIVPVIYRPPER